MEETKLVGMALLIQQLKAMTMKNLLLSWRRRVPTALHLTSSFFFILLIFGVDKSIRSMRKTTTAFKDLPDPPPIHVTPIPPCESGFFIQSPCYDFIWSGNSSSTITLIAHNIMLNNPGRPIPPSKVLGFDTISTAEEWLLEHPLRCTGAIHMEQKDTLVIAYGIQTNSSSKMIRGRFEDPVFKFQLPLQLAAEREISRFLLGDGNIEWTVSFKEFSHPSLDTVSVVGLISPTFLLAASMFGFVIQMSDVIAERESKLRQAMTIMGLLDTAYWTSWFLWEILLGLISSILLVLFGMMFGFYLFKRNSFRLLLCLFFLFQVNMTGYAYMLSGFITKASSAKTVGFCVFIVGFLTQLVTYFGFPYDASFPKYYQIIWSFFPPNLLAVALFYLGKATTNPQDPGISWAGRLLCSFGQPECVLTMDSILRWLLATFFLWMLCAIYIDNVVPDVNGVRKSPLYFLEKSYWTGCGKEKFADPSSGLIADDDQLIKSCTEDDDKDEDVRAEEAAAKKAKHDNVVPDDIAVQVQGLVKTFYKASRRGLFCRPSALHYAVRVLKPIDGFPTSAHYIIPCIISCIYIVDLQGLWMNIRKDSLFCLLGQNGAGKTTTISCITGVLPITHGNVLIYGESVRNAIGMSQIRSFMGVCPQFDILWDVLTGIEHLYLFASIKGLHPSRIKQHTLELLERVKLSDVQHVKVENYSGGMKRRLSVAIAFIGEPKIVCLDEPTTGMDPVTRRHVWSVIEAAKLGRVIILTTHSMEEADILGDQIAIMAKGELCCIGTPIRLKARFGEGYIVNVRIQKKYALSPDSELHKNAIRCFFKEHLDVYATEESLDLLTFIIPYHRELLQLSDFFAKLQETRDELRIFDIYISLTTLEKVFLKMTQQSEVPLAITEGFHSSLTRSFHVPITTEQKVTAENGTNGHEKFLGKSRSTEIHHHVRTEINDEEKTQYNPRQQSSGSCIK